MHIYILKISISTKEKNFKNETLGVVILHQVLERLGQIRNNYIPSYLKKVKTFQL